MSYKVARVSEPVSMERTYSMNHAEQVIMLSSLRVNEFKQFGAALDILMKTGMDQLTATEILLVAMKNKRNRV